jgi:hypothetical protein
VVSEIDIWILGRFYFGFLIFKSGSRPRSLANVQKQCVEDVKNGRPLDAFEARGGADVEALRYQPEGRGTDSQWCHWNFFIDIILPAAL